jgi:nucleoid-associated protein YgaU
MTFGAFIMERIDELKTKYSAALETIKEKGVVLSHINMDGDKLYIEGAAPSEDIKNDVWNQIKAADSSFSDLTCNLTVDSSLPQPAAPAAPAAAAPAERTYTVKPGDTLSGIAKEFYGHAGEYMKIFDANKDKLTNPDVIRDGQELVIPA